MEVWIKVKVMRQCQVIFYIILEIVTNDSPRICKITHQSIQADSGQDAHHKFPWLHCLFCFQSSATLNVFSSFPFKRSTNSTSAIHADISNGRTSSPQKAEGGSRSTLFGSLSQSPLIYFLYSMSHRSSHHRVLWKLCHQRRVGRPPDIIFAFCICEK